MKKAIFEVVKPGLLTTVQDIGRYGYQQYGIVVSGAMDQFAHRLGNLLVGNEPTSATLEVTMMGPKLQVLEDTVIAITGANLSVTIDNQPIEPWKSLFVKKGEILSFGKPEQGVRAYIAVMGGFEGEQVLGSKATYLKAKMGGIAGRELEKGDVLYCGQMTGSFEKLSGRIVSRQLLLNYEQTMPFRVVLGPEEKSFTEAGLKTFFSESFEITREIDRMGCRLSGPVIEHKKRQISFLMQLPLGRFRYRQVGNQLFCSLIAKRPAGMRELEQLLLWTCHVLLNRCPERKFVLSKFR